MIQHDGHEVVVPIVRVWTLPVSVRTRHQVAVHPSVIIVQEHIISTNPEAIICRYISRAR